MGSHEYFSLLSYFSLWCWHFSFPALRQWTEPLRKALSAGASSSSQIAVHLVTQELFAASYPTPQRLGKNFLAGTATDLPCPLARHPNASGAVGPDQYVVYSYAGGRVFDKKTGAIDPVIDVQVMTFFPPSGVDQRIKYDPFSDRWFLTAGDLQGIPNLEISSAGTLNIAFSDCGILTLNTKWQVFIIPGDQIFPPGDFAPWSWTLTIPASTSMPSTLVSTCSTWMETQSARPPMSSKRTRCLKAAPSLPPFAILCPDRQPVRGRQFF